MSHLIEYVRKKGPIVGKFIDEETGKVVLDRAKGTPYGCFWAKKFCDQNGEYKIMVGWSLCCKRDTFSKDEAVALAAERPFDYEFDTKMVIPHSLEKKFIAFCERAKKFYRLNNFTHRYVVQKEVFLDV
jgi:hypothetical protein